MSLSDMTQVSSISLRFDSATASFSIYSVSTKDTITMSRDASEAPSKFLSRLYTNIAKKWQPKDGRSSSKPQKQAGKKPTPEEIAALKSQAAKEPCLVKASVDSESSLAVDADGGSHRTFWKSGMALVAPDLDLTFIVFVDPPSLDESKSRLLLDGKFDVLVGNPIFPPLAPSSSVSSVAHEWRRSSSPDPTSPYVVVSTAPSYIPTSDDVGHFLTFVATPLSDSLSGFPLSLLCGRGAVQPIPDTPLRSLRREFLGSRAASASRLRIMSYNLLADLYTSQVRSQQQIFSHVSPALLSLPRRLPLLLSELVQSKADVLLLQEVDARSFSDFLQPSLQALGYEGIYTNKASNQREGLATFYLKTCFSCIETVGTAVNELFDPAASEGADEWCSAMSSIRTLTSSNPSLREVLLSKVGTVAQVVVLRHSSLNINLSFLNTHLFYHPLADHVRLLQTFAACRLLETVAARHGCEGICIGGDLNSDPMAGACKLLRTGRLLEEEAAFEDCWKNLRLMKWGGGDGDEDGGGDDGQVGQVGGSGAHSDTPPLPASTSSSLPPPQVPRPSAPAAAAPPSLVLPSTFPKLVCLTGFPPFTNYAVGFVETLDYVFVGGKAFETASEGVGAAPCHTREFIKDRYEALPNQDFPSDHISVIADVDINV